MHKALCCELLRNLLFEYRDSINLCHFNLSWFFKTVVCIDPVRHVVLFTRENTALRDCATDKRLSDCSLGCWIGLSGKSLNNLFSERKLLSNVILKIWFIYEDVVEFQRYWAHRRKVVYRQNTQNYEILRDVRKNAKFKVGCKIFPDNVGNLWYGRKTQAFFLWLAFHANHLRQDCFTPCLFKNSSFEFILFDIELNFIYIYLPHSI